MSGGFMRLAVCISTKPNQLLSQVKSFPVRIRTSPVQFRTKRGALGLEIQIFLRK